MFDKLRALKSGAPIHTPTPTPTRLPETATPAVEAPPEPATLGDVAEAIAKAGDFPPAVVEAPETTPVEETIGDEIDEETVEAQVSPSNTPVWRQSVLNSIAETRDDLKTAHANVARLRRRLVEIDRRRVERRNRVAANLDKAEMILAEIRNVWR
jgi:hypothetical protein